MAYTKGEWRLEISEHGWDIKGEHNRIAYYGSTQNPDYVANAHLIAAAPDMYAALKGALVTLRVLQPGGSAVIREGEQALAKVDNPSAL